MGSVARRRPVKVVFIAGLGRSGSTLLGSLLAQLDGFFFTGELISMARYLARGEQCGCGEPLGSCPTWRDVLAQAFPGVEAEAAAAAVALDWSEARALAVPRHLLRAHGLLPANPQLERVRGVFVSVLQAIVAATGSRVVVDSSKWPGYGLLLSQSADVELFVVHVLRDPRAVAHSRRRRALRLSWRDYLGPAHFALVWDAQNLVIESLWRRRRYLQLRYEDFVADPASAVARIVALTGEGAQPLPFLEGGRAVLRPAHSVGGNRLRMRSGEITIEPDEEWRLLPHLSARERARVDVLTWPVRLHYGYGGRAVASPAVAAASG